MKRIKARTGILVILGIALAYYIEPQLNKPPIYKGLEFPRPDSSKGMPVGYDFKMGDYKYVDTTAVLQPVRRTKRVKPKDNEPYQMDEDDMRDELDYISDK